MHLSFGLVINKSHNAVNITKQQDMREQNILMLLSINLQQIEFEFIFLGPLAACVSVASVVEQCGPLIELGGHLQERERERH